jgi:hypothetical protein
LAFIVTALAFVGWLRGAPPTVGSRGIADSLKETPIVAVKVSDLQAGQGNPAIKRVTLTITDVFGGDPLLKGKKCFADATDGAAHNGELISPTPQLDEVMVLQIKLNEDSSEWIVASPFGQPGVPVFRKNNTEGHGFDRGMAFGRWIERFHEANENDKVAVLGAMASDGDIDASTWAMHQLASNAPEAWVKWRDNMTVDPRVSAQALASVPLVERELDDPALRLDAARLSHIVVDAAKRVKGYAACLELSSVFFKGLQASPAEVRHAFYDGLRELVQNSEFVSHAGKELEALIQRCGDSADENGIDLLIGLVDSNLSTALRVVAAKGLLASDYDRNHRTKEVEALKKKLLPSEVRSILGSTRSSAK